jgi:hypothetical protein
MIYALIAGLGAGVALASVVVWSVRITRTVRKSSSAAHSQERPGEAEAGA